MHIYIYIYALHEWHVRPQILRGECSETEKKDRKRIKKEKKKGTETCSFVHLSICMGYHKLKLTGIVYT